MSDARRLSALGLFHPAGSARRLLVLGGACPPGVTAGLPPVGQAGPADLVVVAPTAAECRASGWLAGAAHRAAAALGEDAVAFLIAPVPWRSRLLAATRAEQLTLGPTILHLPALASSRYLVTTGPKTVLYATGCLLPRNSWRGRAASLAARLPGGSRLIALAGRTSVIARRQGDAPLFAWLSEAAGQPVSAEQVVVARTWRADGRAFTVFVVDRGAAQPELVARMGRGPTAARDQLGEERALAEFAPSAQAAGALVPRPLASSRLHGEPLFVETGVPGRVAASLLAERPREVTPVLDRTLAWLLRWNRLTATESTLTTALLENEVLSPARLVAGSVPAADAHFEKLERLCGEVAGSRVTLAAAHDDLTMTNVLLRPDGGLGVVDWETARPDALPLVDFFYSVVDAYAASERYSDRPHAFTRCFSNGSQESAVGVHQSRFERAFSVTPPVLELAFHACWFHHAANELQREEHDGPFVAIVNQIVGQPERFSSATRVGQ